MSPGGPFGIHLPQQTAGNAPIGISQSPGAITCLANQAGGAVIATLTEIGGTGVSVAFSVTGNANLTVVGNQLKTVASPSFTPGVNQTYSLHVTDTGGTFDDPSPRTMIVPAGPSGITHNPDTVLDNATAGTVVSTLTPIGGTAPFTWTIISGFNGYLNIGPTGNTSTLTLNSSGAGHIVSGTPLTGNIQVTDAAGISSGLVAVSVAVNASAGAPTGVTSSPSSIAVASTQAGGATLATLTEVGGSGVSVVFSVTGNSNLTVVGNALKTVASPSFSPGVNQTYTLSVTDTGGTYTDPSPRTLTVYAVPSGITQNPGSITCLANQPGNAVVAALTEIGGTGVSVVFSVTGNANLTISGSNLVTVASPTFSPGVNQTYTLSVTDTGGTFTDPSPRTLTVPAGPTAISFTGTTIVDNAPAGTTVGILTTTGGTAPYAYTCSNSKFTVTGGTVTRSGTGSLTAGVAESLNFASTDAAALSTNTATNGQGPFSVSVSAHGSLSLPVTLNNLAPATSFAAPFVSYSQPFADGDIPVGGSVTMTDSLSNPVTVQMDAVANWPSGCPRWVVLSHACAETFSGGVSKTYTMGSSASAPNNTPNSGTWGGSTAAAWAATLAANSDFKAIYSGFDAGASTYTVSMNTIFSTYTYAATEAWGTAYPTGGWSITKQGLVCIEFHGWQYITNDIGGKTQGYVRCDIWVKAWSPTGPYEIRARTSMPNMWNTVPLSSSAEQFNIRQGRWATALSVQNGATVIQSTGTTADPDAIVVPPGNFTLATNRLSNASFFSACGVSFSSTGTLPSGISSGVVYFPAIYTGTTSQPYLCIDRASQSALTTNGLGAGNPWAANTAYVTGQYRKNGATIYRCVTSGTSAASGGPTGSGTSIPDGAGSLTWQNVTIIFGTQGTATITAFPVSMAFPSTAWHTGDTQGYALWNGTGTRPLISAGHDFSYLTTKSQFTPCYNISAGFQTTGQTAPTYIPNTDFGGIQFDQATGGDGPGDQRIGYISQMAVSSLYNPTDPYYALATIQAGLCWSNFGLNYMNDESGGNPFVGNNGTNNSGTPYTNLPALIPAWNGSNIAGNVASSVQARGAAWSQWSQAYQDQNGYVGQYYPTAVPGAHMPATWQIAYLRTGEPCFLELGIQQANTQCFAGYQGKQVLGGITRYCLINGNYASCQLRAWAWSLRSLSQCVYMTPSNHIFYPVLRDYYNDNAAFQAALVPTYTAAQGTFGILRCLDHGGTGNTAQGHLAPWMGYFLYLAIAQDVWRNLTGATAQANYKTVLDYMAAQWNLYTTAVDPNAINYISSYDLIYSPTSGGSGGYPSSYTSAAALWASSYTQTAQFTAFISGTTMTVTAVASGTLVNQGQVSQAGGIFAAFASGQGQKVTAGGPGGVGTYTVTPGSTTSSRTMYQQSPSASVVPGPPYLSYLYNQNATNFQTSASVYPAHCNWYGSMARAALTMHNIATPGNATIQAVLAAVLSATEAATGIGPTTAGIQWFGSSGGIIQNYQTFAIF